MQKMADSMDLTDVTVPTMEEIQNMKVADLKKKLKEFGLPITGNKTELVDRLQLACLSSKELDSFENSQLSLDESQINELENTDNSATLEDSDLLLLNSGSYISSSQESKILDGAENKLNIISNSTSVTMPLKKRSLSKTDSEGTGMEKKVQLKRTNTTHIDFSVKAASDSKPVAVTSNDKNDTEEKKVLSAKNMSAAERLAMRAKRFNTGNSTVTTTNSSKFTNSRNSKQSILSSSVPPDLEVLKKRAERFGQSVSTVMKQIEQKERLLKRKCKFGASLAISAVSSIDEQAKKKQRAERFGMS